MRNNISILIFITLFINNICSQTGNNIKEFGLYYDINGLELNNYCDLDYNPKKAFSINFEIGTNFTQGVYYDLAGIKHTGLIKRDFTGTKVKFKLNKSSKQETLKPESVLGYKSGIDSFAVIKNFEVEKFFGYKIVADENFAEVISDKTNYVLYNLTTKGFSNDVTEFYIIKSDTSKRLRCFPIYNSKKFTAMALRYFGNCPVIKELLVTNRYKSNMMPTIIKLYEYYQKYLSKTKIFYSDSWDEVDDSLHSSYYANISDLKDTIWELKYFNNAGLLLYQGHYSSFAPIFKDGEFIWYYSNGIPRKKITYKNDKIDGSIIEYFNNGKTHYIYNLKKDYPYYLAVFDSTGKSILNEMGDGSEHFYDSILNRNIVKSYVSNNINICSFVDDKKRNIYQTCENNAHITFFDFYQNKITDKIKYPEESIIKYNHGIMLISFLIDSLGNTLNFKIIKGLDANCDKAITDFLNSKKAKPSWKVAKNHNLTCFQEIVVPVYFNLVGLSSGINTNFYFNDWFIQQQMMQPRFNPPTPSFH